MEGDFVFNLEETMKNITEAEAMSLFFPVLRKAVVIDTRSNGQDGPLVRLMPIVGSPRERLRTIRRLRPTFPRIHELALVPWYGYVDSLVEAGVWDRIVQRFRDAGQVETVAQCDSVLYELRRQEKLELAAVVLGQNYRTIWSARR